MYLGKNILLSTSVRDSHGALIREVFDPRLHVNAKASTIIQCDKTVSSVQLVVAKATSQQSWELGSPARGMLEQIHPRIHHILFLSPHWEILKTEVT